jgi:hypothetical protein
MTDAVLVNSVPSVYVPDNTPASVYTLDAHAARSPVHHCPHGTADIAGVDEVSLNCVGKMSETQNPVLADVPVLVTVMVYMIASPESTGLDIDCLVIPRLGYPATIPVAIAVLGLDPVSVSPHSSVNVAVLVKIVPAG